MLRTPLVLLFGSLIVGCTVGDPGTGGDDDDSGGAVCGDGAKQGNEACDDGNAANGDGCSSTCTVEVAVPRLDVLIDKPTISTELRTTHMVTVTLGAAGGFAGPVSLAATVVDGAGVAIPGWTVALDKPSIDVPANGGGTAIATVTVPSTNKGLTGTVKIDVTAAGVPAKQVTTAVTALNQITIPMTLSGGQCVYPAAGTVPVTVGTKVRWLNKAAANLTIHIGGNTNGFAHQPDPGSAPNAAYEQTVTGTPGGPITWYCHAPGPTVNNLLLQAVAP